MQLSFIGGVIGGAKHHPVIAWQLANGPAFRTGQSGPGQTNQAWGWVAAGTGDGTADWG